MVSQKTANFNLSSEKLQFEKIPHLPLNNVLAKLEPPMSEYNEEMGGFQTCHGIL
jgi:hypothetical protein